MIYYNNIKNKLHSFLKKHYKRPFQYMLIIFAVLSLIWIIYVKFIRKRVFRVIPFTLTEIWFYTLLFIIFIHVYIIINIIRQKTPVRFAKEILSYLSLPFVTLDKLLKTNKHTMKYNKLLLKLITPSYTYSQITMLLCFDLIPKMLLLYVFLLDVFYFHHLARSYSFLFLAMFPLLYNYYKFSMFHAKEIILEYLELLYSNVIVYEKGYNDLKKYYYYDEEGYITDIPLKVQWKPHDRNKYHEVNVTIKEYLQILVEKDIDELENNYDLFPSNKEGYGKDYYEFDPFPIAQDWYSTQYEEILGKTKLDTNDYNNLAKEFHEIMPQLVEISLHLHYFPDQEKYYYIPYLKAFFYTLYLIAWCYILMKSYSTITDLPITLKILTLLTTYTTEMNPFLNP